LKEEKVHRKVFNSKRHERGGGRTAGGDVSKSSGKITFIIHLFRAERMSRDSDLQLRGSRAMEGEAIRGEELTGPQGGTIGLGLGARVERRSASSSPRRRKEEGGPYNAGSDLAKRRA